MSKMGRYVFQIQEEIDQDDYRDRERGSDAGPETEGHPIPKAPPTEEVQRSTRR